MPKRRSKTGKKARQQEEKELQDDEQGAKSAPAGRDQEDDDQDNGEQVCQLTIQKEETAVTARACVAW